LKELLADWKMLLGVAVGIVAGIILLAYAFIRPATNQEEAERKRRLHLNQIGRIAEGQIVELVEHPPESKKASKGLFGAGARPLRAGARSRRCADRQPA